MRNDFAELVPGIAAWRRPPTAKDNSDEALIAKIACGNRLAMQVLFARHHARIYRFVLRLIGSEALAEDITSEVFLDVWRQARRFEARSAVTTSLLAIARYEALAEMRRRYEASDEGTVDASDPADDPEATFDISVASTTAPWSARLRASDVRTFLKQQSDALSQIEKSVTL